MDWNAYASFEAKAFADPEVQALRRPASGTMKDGFSDVAPAILSQAPKIPGSPLCGTNRTASAKDQKTMENILNSKLGIIALSFQTPATLQNSMASWKEVPIAS